MKRCALTLCVLLYSALVLLSPRGLAQTAPAAQDGKLRALIVDGQNNHRDWRVTTALLRRFLEQSGRFTVDVATTPPTRGDMSKFQPRFADYQVVVSNYNGDRWPAETEQAFESYVAGGGGFVSYHAADNAFTDWPAYNKMCGLGGWGGRTDKAGPLVYLNDDGQLQQETKPGPAGHHGDQHEFQVRIRDAEHPITKGLPTTWMHTKDELYDSLRGPAENMKILATAYSDPKTKGTGRHEPMLMAIDYGKGRVFHTTLGHTDYSVKCVGFITTFTRGAEWAATGKVTIPVPDDFPEANKSSSRETAAAGTP
jgi:type 1 glutamine amidotransferase